MVSSNIRCRDCDPARRLGPHRRPQRYVDRRADRQVVAADHAQPPVQDKDLDGTGEQRVREQAGQPGDPPLVDKLAELKMIRALQMRINRRTQRYGAILEGEQAETPELLDALVKLAERQQRVYQATQDLAQGRND